VNDALILCLVTRHGAPDDSIEWLGLPIIAQAVILPLKKMGVNNTGPDQRA